MQDPRHTSPYRWVIITLCLLTGLFTVAVPTMSLSVLFAEISADLSLDILQVGLIWSISSFTGMFLGLAGGILGDRFGARDVLTLACLGIGLTGASRGLAPDFNTFLACSFFLGIFSPLIGINLHAVAGHWFSKRQMGLANGFVAAGFAGGFMLGSLLAANTLSPLLGGWRNVFFAYGGISIVLAVAWFLLHPKHEVKSHQPRMPLAKGIPLVLRNRTIWLMGLGRLCFWACIRGFTGYTPLYLRNVGWQPQSADNVISSFFLVSLFGSILIPIFSDRIGVRRPFLVAAALLAGIGVMATGFVDSTLIIFAAIIAGVMFDAFMGLSVTTIIEIKEFRGVLIGTAIGVINFLSQLGGTISPIIGNSLADSSAELPFFFWGALALIATVPFAMIKEDRSG